MEMCTEGLMVRVELININSINRMAAHIIQVMAYCSASATSARAMPLAGARNKGQFFYQVLVHILHRRLRRSKVCSLTMGQEDGTVAQDDIRQLQSADHCDLFLKLVLFPCGNFIHNEISCYTT